MVNNITGKLEVGPTVLVEQGKKGIKLCLYKTDDVGSSFFSKDFEVKLGSGVKCFCSGLKSRW